MSGGLRYTTTANMPEPMRQAVERALQREQRIAAVPQPVEKADRRRSKHGNRPTTVDGIRFQSKREARLYERLKLQREAGEVSYFLRQVPMHLPGGTRYIVDFIVFMRDGRVRYLDAKGFETKVFKLKKREIQHHYPVEIECV